MIYGLMKTYLLDSYNRYRRYSETLDVKTQLCNRTWVVFNDGDERELYKFKEDGTIRIILSGRVSSGTWEFDPNDKSMIISASDQSIMVHPGMHEGILMGLQVDGTEECAFLIEENNAHNFAPKTRTELIQYFEEQERKRIEEQQRILALEAERLRIEADRQRRMEAERIAAERKVQAAELERQKERAIENQTITDFETFLREKGYHSKKAMIDTAKMSSALETFLIILVVLVLVGISFGTAFIILELNTLKIIGNGVMIICLFTLPLLVPFLIYAMVVSKVAFTKKGAYFDDYLRDYIFIKHIENKKTIERLQELADKL